MITGGSGDGLWDRHCEQSEAIQFFAFAGLLRRFAPRNDGQGQGQGRMSIVAIIVAVIAAFLVFRFVTGMLKFVVILAILAVAAYVLLNGGLA